MNIKEVCDKFHLSESYIKKNFNLAQKSILKKYGIKLEKYGRGAAATYEIVQDNSRAITLWQEDKKTVMLNHHSMKELSLNMEFATLLGIIMTPLEVFRGSYKDFLSYIQINKTEQNILHLKSALNFLQEKEYIHYAIDKTNSDYFFAGIYRKVEQELSLQSNMIDTCRRLQLAYKKKSWVPLLKYWLGIKYLYTMSEDKIPYTRQGLSDLTGLNLYQIDECGKILEKDRVFRSDKVYVGYRSLGKTYTLNGIHEGNNL